MFRGTTKVAEVRQTMNRDDIHFPPHHRPLRDDKIRIIDNPLVRRLWPPWEAMALEPPTPTPVRPPP